nr:biorientation of chromosomes in cell division protein 1-like 1 [Limnephilus lunatus]
MEIAQSLPLLPGDPRLIDHIVCELKSQGIFDQFRKECIADVDTKPAYQNLRQRVEGSVAGFLSNQKWKPDLNKNQLREKLRKHILDSNFLDQGVERIVDQAVNPKIASVFLPQVEEVVYKCFGVEKPDRSDQDHANGVSTSELRIVTEDLLPEDLEAVSPDSVKSHEKPAENLFENIELPPDQIMVEKKEETEVKVDRIYPSVDTEESDDSKDEEFESPAFEPLDDDLVKREGSPNNSQMSRLSDLNSRDSDSNSIADKVKKSNNEKVSESQLSQASNDSEVSIKVSKLGKKSLMYDSTFSGDDANINSPAKREPADGCYKFSNHEDNSSDARQCFEPAKEEPMECDDSSVDKSFTKSEVKTEDVVKSTSSSETAEPIKHHRSSVDSKTSSEGLKIVDKFDGSLDSTELNSIYTSTVKTESYIVKDSYTFTNKITSMDEGSMDDDSSSNGLKIDLQETVQYSEENITGINRLSISEEANMKSPIEDVKKDKLGRSERHKSSSKDERRSSSGHHRDKRDDHHKSSHSRHRESSGHHERKHSSSQDRKEGSHSKSSKESGDKDKYGKSSNGESRKESSSDRHKSSSSRHSSSSKHYSSSKHRDDSHRSRHSTSDKSDRHSLSRQDSHRSDKDRDSSKRSESKEPSKHRDKGSDHSSTERSKSSLHGSKDKSSSKHSHHDKDRKSSSGDKKDDKKSKDKSEKDDHYSSSGRGNRTRRSTDRDSNDGNNGSNKSSSSNSVESSSTSANPSNKEKSNSSSKDNCSNGNVSSGQSDSITKAAKDKLNILAGGYIKSEFNMFEPVVKKPVIPLMNLHRSPEATVTKKPVIHIDSQLNPSPVKIEPEKIPEPIVEETVPKLKKPKFASNIFEARKLMKVRKNMDKMELKRKQDAQELIEKQNNISKNESRIFSGVSGPELHIACTKNVADTPKKSPKIRKSRDDSDLEPDFLGFDDESRKKLQIDLEKVKKHLKNYLATVNGVEHRFDSVVHLIGCDKSLEQAFVRLSRKNHMIKTVNLRKNGFVKQNVEKPRVSPQNIVLSPDSDLLPSSSRCYVELSDIKNSMQSEMMKAMRLPLKKRKLAQRKIIKSLEMKPEVFEVKPDPVLVQEKPMLNYDYDDSNIRNYDNSNQYGSEYYSKMDDMLSRATKQDIMEIILGGDMKFDASNVDLKLVQNEFIHHSSDADKIIDAVVEKPNGKVTETPRKRKITFEIAEEKTEGQITNFNNNLKQQNEPTVAKRRYIQKVASPEESKGVALVPTNNATGPLGKARRNGLPKSKKSSGISRNLSVPSSPESDKSVENHINRDVFSLKSKNFKENSEDVGSTALNHANHQMVKRTRNNYNKDKITVKKCINEKLFESNMLSMEQA